MHCNFAEKISAWMDGELPLDESRAVEKHLLECRHCQEMRADFLNLRSEIASYPVPGNSSPVFPLKPESRTARVLPSFRMGWPRPVFAALATVALIICGVVGWLYFSARNRESANNFIAQSPKSESSKKVPAPSPSPSRESNSPAKGTREADEPPPQSPPKFRRREAITALPRAERRLPSSSSESGGSAATTTEADLVVAAANGLRVTPADAQTLTALHVEQSELLLRSFRNLKTTETATGDNLNHERQRAQKLFYQNVMLRREADSSGDVEVASLLQSLEPILLDIANLPQRAPRQEVRAIKDRVERQNLVALLQISSKPFTRTNN